MWGGNAESGSWSEPREQARPSNVRGWGRRGLRAGTAAAARWQRCPGGAERAGPGGRESPRHARLPRFLSVLPRDERPSSDKHTPRFSAVQQACAASSCPCGPLKSSDRRCRKVQQAAWGQAGPAPRRASRKSCSPAPSQRHSSVFFRGKQIGKGATGTRASLAAHPSDNNSFISELTKNSTEILIAIIVRGAGKRQLASASFPLEGSFTGDDSEGVKAGGGGCPDGPLPVPRPSPARAAASRPGPTTSGRRVSLPARLCARPGPALPPARGFWGKEAVPDRAAGTGGVSEVCCHLFINCGVDATGRYSGKRGLKPLTMCLNGALRGIQQADIPPFVRPSTAALSVSVLGASSEQAAA
ncbi:uncharacterized protein LOC110401323 [Numida meleagris]|uniref:uncharacterized protein LOC110401323 n=1 Tax=Numida meleagris TaxID=8996 RepID=UPI000B3E043E|nr:uncharacterized protein LOC110401323 [Numida meleagris]